MMNETYSSNGGPLVFQDVGAWLWPKYGKVELTGKKKGGSDYFESRLIQREDDSFSGVQKISYLLNPVPVLETLIREDI